MWVCKQCGKRLELITEIREDVCIDIDKNGSNYGISKVIHHNNEVDMASRIGGTPILCRCISGKHKDIYISSFKELSSISYWKDDKRTGYEFDTYPNEVKWELKEKI